MKQQNLLILGTSTGSSYEIILILQTGTKSQV